MQPTLLRKKVLILFGTRPEVIKFAPILHELKKKSLRIHTVNVASAQHAHFLSPLALFFNLQIDYTLHSMAQFPSPLATCRRIIRCLHPILAHEKPDLILVQGDTTTALAGAIAGAQHQIPVGHVEAGLRTGDLTSPFPEEANRRVIGRLATYHFAPTDSNRQSLLREGVHPDKIFVTGNPGVDALLSVLRSATPTAPLRDLLQATANTKRLVLTAHRRENLGPRLEACFAALRRFVETHADVTIIFPVHPNPGVIKAAKLLCGHQRIHLVKPLSYPDFVHLMHQSWLIISDSGGIQEEVPSLGQRLLILRNNTERPEAVACGAAQLVGTSPKSLTSTLEDLWLHGPTTVSQLTRFNPFGQGDSGIQIVNIIESVLSHEESDGAHHG